MGTITDTELIEYPSAFLVRLKAGESLSILCKGMKLADMNSYPILEGDRPDGLAAGLFVVPDDFDDPLPEEILRDFEGR